MCGMWGANQPLRTDQYGITERIPRGRRGRRDRAPVAVPGRSARLPRAWASRLVMTISCRPALSISETSESRCRRPRSPRRSRRAADAASGRPAVKMVNSPLMASAGANCSRPSRRLLRQDQSVTAASICAGWKGLTTQALAPAAWPSAFFASPASVVSMMTGWNFVGRSCFAALTKLMPSMFGMFTSLMIRWIFLPSSLDSASLPSHRLDDVVAGALERDADNLTKRCGVVDDHDGLPCEYPPRKLGDFRCVGVPLPLRGLVCPLCAMCCSACVGLREIGQAMGVAFDGCASCCDSRMLFRAFSDRH